MRFRLLACDYDRTIATEGVVVEQVKRSLTEVRDSGRRLLLVTGRTMEELLDVFQDLPLFDRIVCENGALLYSPDTRAERLLCPPVPPELVADLRRSALPRVVAGRGIVSAPAESDVVVEAAMRRLGVEWELIYNRDSVMVLAPGCSKASGLGAAAADLGVAMQQVVTVGDGENDAALLEAGAIGVAVENAVDMLKERADIVLTRPGPDGISDLCASLAQHDLADLLEASAVAS